MFGSSLPREGYWFPSNPTHDGVMPDDQAPERMYTSESGVAESKPNPHSSWAGTRRAGVPGYERPRRRQPSRFRRDAAVQTMGFRLHHGGRPA